MGGKKVKRIDIQRDSVREQNRMKEILRFASHLVLYFDMMYRRELYVDGLGRTDRRDGIDGIDRAGDRKKTKEEVRKLLNTTTVASLLRLNISQEEEEEEEEEEGEEDGIDGKKHYSVVEFLR